MRKINALSLFSSAGIGELNIHKGNINFIAANELLEKRAEYYQFFYPETKMFQGDITNSKLKKELINYSKNKNVKFLLATPPCQGFSSAGKNKNQKHFLEDKRNFLIFDVFDFIDKLDLDYILIENVPRFLEMYFPYKNQLMKIEEIIKDKYSKIFNVEVRVLNAKDYGVAQSRPRAVIKLYKKNISWGWPIKQEEIPLKDVIGHLPPLKNGECSPIKWHSAKKIREEIEISLKNTPTGKSAIQNPIHYPKKSNGERIKGFHNTYKRMDWDAPASARTTYSGSVSSHNNVHPGRKLKNGEFSDPRALSLLETFIVSSISETIDFPEKSSETFIRTIIGEAIPPLLLERICYPNGEDL